MLRSVLTFTLLLLSLSTIATAGDLYEVVVDSRDAASTLTACRIDGVWRTDNGYLVLVDGAGLDRLNRSGLEFKLVATDVKRAEMAIDLRHDHSNVGRYPLLYEDGELRLFRADPIEASRDGETPGLAPLRTEGMSIVYRESRPLNMGRMQQMMDLDSLIGQVRQDSLFSYSTQLESFMWRVTGTSGNYISRNWIIDKLDEFGYDSIVIDSFVTEIYDRPRKVYNVVAVKPGADYPMHEIIVGGHRDAVPGSPGADDNGSGTVATLEIARILADIDTRMTFKFILFDGEEQGLHGSWHYASQAAASGDSIVFMENMDMIAHYANSDQAKIFRGSNDIYGPLWQTLADSLDGIDITANLLGMSSGSDHYPFYQNGFDAIFAHEYIFSSVYHSPRDSTTWMNFDYFTRMTKACLATAYVVDATYEVAPMLALDLLEEPAPIFYPDLDTHVVISILEYAGEEIVPFSGQLYYSVNEGAFTAVPLSDLGGGLYRGNIPGQACFSTIDYYFSAEGVYGGVINYPDPSQPLMTMVATGYSVPFTDNAQEDLGWTVGGNTELGAWVRGEPDGAYGAPGRDYDQSGYCYHTGDGYGTDVDYGMTSLTSPVIDLTTGVAVLQYARWYSNSSGAAPYSDVFSVGLSPNGGQNWTNIETVGPVEGADGGWVLRRLWVEDMIPGALSLQLRFAAEDDGDDSQIEAAVDAVRVVQYTCDPLIITEQLPDWTVGMAYSRQLIAVGGEGSYSFDDLNNDLAGSGLDLSVEGLVSGTPVVEGLISFTAEVADSIGQTDARLYEFLINTVPEVATTSLPDATAGVLYEQQLVSTGGTGAATWFDLNDDLVSTGLSLSADGMLSGTPVDTGVLIFTARIEDETSAFDEQPLSLRVRIWFVCGDIDNSGAGPDISDLVYLVDYMFNDGPPPTVMEAADVNNSGGDLDIADLVHLVDYMFTGGPPPDCP